MVESRIWYIHNPKYMIKYEFKYKHKQEEGYVINEYIRRISPVIDELMIWCDSENPKQLIKESNNETK